MTPKVPHRELERADVERICRDVIATHGLAVTLLHVDRTYGGWRITAKDRDDRLINAVVPDGSAAVIRAALTGTLDQD